MDERMDQRIRRTREKRDDVERIPPRIVRALAEGDDQLAPSRDRLASGQRLELQAADELEQRLVRGADPDDVHALAAKLAQVQRAGGVEVAKLAQVERARLVPFPPRRERVSRLAERAYIEHAFEREAIACAANVERRHRIGGRPQHWVRRRPDAIARACHEDRVMPAIARKNYKAHCTTCRAHGSFARARGSCGTSSRKHAGGRQAGRAKGRKTTPQAVAG
jgi:hypothetical protein